MTLGRRADKLRIEAACDINYESLDRALGRDVDKACYYLGATEPAAAVIEGEVVTSGKRPRLDSPRIDVGCAAGGFEEISAIEMPLKNVPLRRLRLTPGSASEVCTFAH